MSAEVLLAAGYAGLLAAGAFMLEWLSAHTHRRALRFRTAGFSYDETQDHWLCPEGQHLWPHEFDRSAAWSATGPRPTSATAARASRRAPTPTEAARS